MKTFLEIKLEPQGLLQNEYRKYSIKPRKFFLTKIITKKVLAESINCSTKSIDYTDEYKNFYFVKLGLTYEYQNHMKVELYLEDLFRRGGAC